jgi:hypothetical protein
MIDMTGILFGPTITIPSADRFLVDSFRANGEPLTSSYGPMDEITAQKNLDRGKKMFELLHQKFIIPDMYLSLFDTCADLEMDWRSDDGSMVGFDIRGEDKRIRMSFFLRSMGEKLTRESALKRYKKAHSHEAKTEEMTIEHLEPLCKLLEILYEDRKEK